MAGKAAKAVIKLAAKYRIRGRRPVAAHGIQASPASVTVALLVAPAALGVPHLVRAAQIISALAFAPVRSPVVPAALELKQILDRALLAPRQLLRDQGALGLRRAAGQQEGGEQPCAPAGPTALPAPEKSLRVAEMRRRRTPGTDRRRRHCVIKSASRRWSSLMGHPSINDVIRLYSAGMISRASLEEEIQARKPARAETLRRARSAEIEDCIDLYPDGAGTWRALN